LKISDEAHAKLTSVVGRLMAETGKTKTYSDAIEALLRKTVLLSPELLNEVESFIKGNAQLGYATKEEFIQDATRSELAYLTEKKEAHRILRKKQTKIKMIFARAINDSVFAHSLQ
jgi:metal-responsive CopG/Arc/MetJ family transcriptional regulator